MKYTILLKQHIGAPDKPVVTAGVSVKCGEVIAVPTGLGAPIHAPFDAAVCKITEDSIILEGTDHPETETFVPLTGEDERELLAASGIVGLGGAGFPTSVKCSTDLKGGHILVNASECEPLLGHNIRQVEEKTSETMEGIKIVMRLCNASEAIIAIKEKHREAVELLNRYCAKEEHISCHLLPDLYPMGEERAVVRETLGTLLSPTDLPSAAGAVVMNVETVLRVAEAVLHRRPCITKNISVAGKLKGGTHTRIFFDVPIGTTVGELIQRAGGIDGDYGEIIMGGPFTGRSVSPDTPITKTTGGIIVTAPFENLQGAKLGLLLCACGGSETRMRELADKMNGEVVCVQKCKQAAEVKGALKCENPGNCPGQAQKCLNFKAAGCTDILIGNCSDCTNTVMGSAPKLGLTVHHQTDHVLDTVGLPRMRHLTKSKKVSSELPRETVMSAGSTITENSGKPADPAESAAQSGISQTVENGILKIAIKEGKNIYIEIPL